MMYTTVFSILPILKLNNIVKELIFSITHNHKLYLIGFCIDLLRVLYSEGISLAI